MRPREGGGSTPAPTERDEELVAAAAAVLQASGESTSVTLDAVDRMNRGLHTAFELVPAWTAMTLVDRKGGARSVPRITAAPPTGISMRAVAGLMRVIDQVGAHTADRADLVSALTDAKNARPAGFWVFVLACATGSGALSVIFGAQDVRAVLLVAASAALGGVARRGLAKAGVGTLGQVFAAALIAGLLGGLAVHADLSSALRLIAVCPAMILVPGPHILNGALDLVALRIPLGFARLGYAAIVLLAIGTGLALGLAVWGTDLPLAPPGRDIPLWLDVIAAGIAAASYPVYFAMPYRLIVWPVVVGAAAHGVRWWAMEVWDGDIVFGAFIACILVGAVLAPVAHRRHVPFAGIGFAAVVSLVPGVYVFRTIDALGTLAFGGSTEDLVGAASDGAIGLFIVMAMSVGLVVPMQLYRRFARVSRR